MIENIKNNILKYIKEKHLSVAELERMTGITHSVVNIIHGRSKNPSIKIISAIANSLEVSIEDLMGKPYIPTNKINKNLLRLCLDITLDELEMQKVTLNHKKIFEIAGCAADFSQSNNEESVDRKFIRWQISNLN